MKKNENFPTDPAQKDNYSFNKVLVDPQFQRQIVDKIDPHLK